MLHMVSGLPIYTDFLDDVTGIDNQALVAKVGARKLGFATGTRWKYNNSDYALAASIVQRVAKEPFARFMQAQIFGPLGMAHTLVLDTPGANVPERAQGYTPKKGGGFRAVREDTAIVGDGQVFSSAEDLLRWDRALREHTLVGPELAALAEASGTLDSGKQTGYGFGWFPYRDRGHVLVNHEGEWTGTNTYISRNLEDGTCVIVLANNDALGAGDLGTAVEQALGSP
jgi:CubicO group peptidase (beta-lactamase class C family)